MCASFIPPEITIQMANPSVQLRVQGSRQKSLLTMGFSFSLNCPFPWGIWTPSNTVQYMVLWAHPSPQPKRHLDRFSRFCRAH